MTRFILRSCLILAACGASLSPALAQSKVGSAMVDGRVVDLFEDNSWQFRDGTADAPCETISDGVEFCDPQKRWKLVGRNEGEIAAQYRFSDTLYGMFITEEIGSDDGLTLEVMREAVLVNAAGQSAMSADDIVVLDVDDSDFQGRSATTMTYIAPVNNMQLTMRNTIVSMPHRTVQLVTYGIGKATTDKLSDHHADFVSLVTLK